MSRRTRQPAATAGEPERRVRAQRARVADLAARLFVEHGLADLHQGIVKAARQLGLHEPRDWPTLAQVEAELSLRQRLFHPESGAQLLHRYRVAALAAMQALARFEPRLVGAVWHGFADAHTPVQLHLFADDPDQVQRHLDEWGVPYRQSTHTAHFGRARREQRDSYTFLADGVPFLLIVFGQEGLHEAPREAGTDQPMERAGPAQLRRLLDDGHAPDQPRRSSAT